MRCLADIFKLSDRHFSQPLVYVDASASCNDLMFQFGSTVVGTTAVSRAWRIKITQYSCAFPNKAPPGCDQVN